MTLHATFLYCLDLVSGLYNSMITFLTTLLFKIEPPKVYTHGAIIITGCTSQMGEHVCHELLNKGFTVFACVKDLKQSNYLLEELNPKITNKLHLIQMDVTSPLMIDHAMKTIRSKLSGLPLVGLVHCAGALHVSPLEYTTREDFLQVFQTNTLGPLLVTQACMELLKHYESRVVFVSSISGWTSAPLNGCFAASKMALESMADTLRVELAPWNISISIIEAGSMDTNFHTKSILELVSLDSKMELKGFYDYQPLISTVKSILSETRPLSVGYSTRAIMDALFNPRPRTRYFVGWDSRATWFLSSFLPDRLLDALFTSTMAKKQDGLEKRWETSWNATQVQFIQQFEPHKTLL